MITAPVPFVYRNLYNRRDPVLFYSARKKRFTDKKTFPFCGKTEEISQSNPWKRKRRTNQEKQKQEQYRINTPERQGSYRQNENFRRKNAGSSHAFPLRRSKRIAASAAFLPFFSFFFNTRGQKPSHSPKKQDTAIFVTREERKRQKNTFSKTRYRVTKMRFFMTRVKKRRKNADFRNTGTKKDGNFCNTASRKNGKLPKKEKLCRASGKKHSDFCFFSVPDGRTNVCRRAEKKVKAKAKNQPKREE